MDDQKFEIIRSLQFSSTNCEVPLFRSSFCKFCAGWAGNYFVSLLFNRYFIAATFVKQPGYFSRERLPSGQCSALPTKVAVAFGLR